MLAPVLIWALASLGCGGHKDDEEPKASAPVVVAKASLDQTLPDWTELIGSTQPLPGRIARVTTAVEAQVRWILSDKDDAKLGDGIKEGDWITKGTPIVQLDDRVILANLAQKRAGLDKLKNLKMQADVDVRVARLEIKRLEDLKKTVNVAESEIEKANLALEIAQLKVKGVNEDSKAAQADLAALQDQHAYYTLKAPIDGMLGRIEVARGQTLPVGTRVAEIVNLRKEIDVLCFVPPANIGKIRVGLPAVLIPDAPFPSSLPDGTVVFKDEQAQPETGSCAVKVRFPNAMKLDANAVLSVRVRTRVKAHCNTIPEDAVLEDQDPPVVVVVREEKRKNEKGKEEEVLVAYRIPVRIGIRDREKKRIEILEVIYPAKKEGESPGIPPRAIGAELFVVEGGHGLEDKDEVKLEQAKEKAE